MEAMEHHAPPPPPAPPAPASEPVKVEKIDLTEEDDEASLDSTLCHVAEYEGGYDGSNPGLDQMPMLSAAELGGCEWPDGTGPERIWTEEGVLSELSELEWVF